MWGEKNKTVNGIYLHGRPSAHSLHSALAKAVTRDFRFIDAPIRWQDKNRGIVFNIAAWFFNALLFKNKKNYSFFLIDNLHVTPIIMRKLGLISKKQKLLVHLGSHTLYFMYSGQFSKLNLAMHKYALHHYDALLCEGEMAKELAQLILKEKCPPVYVTFIGPLTNRIKQLNSCTPQLQGNKLLIIGGGPAEFRMFYKGLDIMISAFDKAFQTNPLLELYILGDWSQSVINTCLQNCSARSTAAIHFMGRITDTEKLIEYISNSALCIHCTRGDAFPTSTMEAMSAGIPTLVSEWTGTKEIITTVSKQLIVPLDATIIAERIGWYFSLSIEEKLKLSITSRKAVAYYNEENAILHYQHTFTKMAEVLPFS